MAPGALGYRGGGGGRFMMLPIWPGTGGDIGGGGGTWKGLDPFACGFEYMLGCWCCCCCCCAVGGGAMTAPLRVAGRDESKPAPNGGEEKPLAVDALGRRAGDATDRYVDDATEENCDAGAIEAMDGRELSGLVTSLRTTPSRPAISLLRGRGRGGRGGAKAAEARPSALLSDRLEAER